MSKREIFNPKSNGLGFLRLYLAITVLLDHALTAGGFMVGNLVAESFLGYFAVDSFFAISGFLITKSYAEKPNFSQFLSRRILRIFPGFWACLLVCSLIFYPIGVFLLTGSFGAVMTNQIIEYISQNFFLYMGDRNLVWLNNGVFWSLFPEFVCYLIVGLLGSFKTLNRFNLLIIFVFYWTLFIYFPPSPINLVEDGWYSFSRTFPFFMSGAICYLSEKQLSWSWKWWGLSCIVVLIAYSLIPLRFIAMPILIYFLLGLAKILPKNIERKYGDYSYGIYLYHFPVCELLRRLEIHQLPVYLGIVLIISAICSYLSWNYIEKPSLKLKLPPRLMLLRLN